MTTKPKLQRHTMSPYDKGGEIHGVPCMTAKQGGFDPATGAVVPFKVKAHRDVYDVEAFTVEAFLWNIVAAVEAGKTNPDKFFAQFFSSLEEVEDFADALEEYGAGGGWWVNERFFYALEEGFGAGEEDLVTFETMADAFRQAARFDASAPFKEPAAKKKKPAAKKKAPARKKTK